MPTESTNGCLPAPFQTEPVYIVRKRCLLQWKQLFMRMRDCSAQPRDSPSGMRNNTCITSGPPWNQRKVFTPSQVFHWATGESAISLVSVEEASGSFRVLGLVMAKVWLKMFGILMANLHLLELELCFSSKQPWLPCLLLKLSIVCSKKAVLT